jgi:phytoene dehydrogenase-like protein
VECINVMNRQPADFGWKDTIIFFNQTDRFQYACPNGLVDPASGVICIPNNYKYKDGMQLKEGLLRVTAIANFEKWSSLAPDDYYQAKEEWFKILINGALKMLPEVNASEFENSTVAKDMFTPTTIKKYTGHLGGAVYGASAKRRDGSTSVENLFLCGTDQGFLGIVGAMLSGISMANYHILNKS